MTLRRDSNGRSSSEIRDSCDADQLTFLDDLRGLPRCAESSYEA